MELTLKRLLEQAKFTPYKGKGYEATEVDTFLDRAAAMASKVEVQLTQAMDKAPPGGGAPAPDPAAVEAEIERRVADRLSQRAASGPSEEESAEEARRTLVLAQRTADSAMRDARNDADKLVVAAKERAEALVADAEASARAVRSDSEAAVARERNTARQQLAEEIAALEGAREALRTDIATLEGHVEQQRTQLGSMVAALQRLIDDPDGFRIAPIPTLNDPDIPDLEPDPKSDPEASPTNSDPEPPADSQAALAEAPIEPPAVAPAPQESGASLARGRQAESPPTAPALPPRRPEATAAGTGPAVRGFDEVDHENPGTTPTIADGSPTASVDPRDDAASGESSGDDAFLAELRKAMVDDEPLGPRESARQEPQSDLFDDDRRPRRFGRRR
ncbi:MAG: hypothetical protein ACR2MB_04900 [Acidimicrobiales bacterium]